MVPHETKTIMERISWRYFAIISVVALSVCLPNINGDEDWRLDEDTEGWVDPHSMIETKPSKKTSTPAKEVFRILRSRWPGNSYVKQTQINPKTWLFWSRCLLRLNSNSCFPLSIRDNNGGWMGSTASKPILRYEILKSKNETGSLFRKPTNREHRK